eukprot:3231460-Rhodomonas_salina.1
MSGTDIAYQVFPNWEGDETEKVRSPPLSCYARATRCPVLSCRTLLPGVLQDRTGGTGPAWPGTDAGHGPTREFFFCFVFCARGTDFWVWRFLGGGREAAGESDRGGEREEETRGR